MTALSKYFLPYGCTVQYLSDGQTPQRYRYVIEGPFIKKLVAFRYDIEDIDYNFWNKTISKLISILANDIKLDSNIDYDDELISEFIKSHYLVLNPEDKLNAVLEFIQRMSKYDGQMVSAELNNPIDALKLYFNNKEEWDFYRSTAIELGYIREDYTLEGINYGLTIKGLGRIVEIIKGKESNICFVAMAFTDAMRIVYDRVIQPTIIACGYDPYIVNSQTIQSDRTINDAILAGIKKAKFTIADFTEHRNGVYFEAGFALGRGQKVIYMCKEDHMVNSHFDLRNYQHIVWKDNDDLVKKLTDKIEAFINE